MTKRFLAGALACAALCAAAARAADRTEGLRALDYGNLDSARALLAADAAEGSVWLALAENGEARTAAAERALALAPSAESWVAPAATALIELEAEHLAEAATAAREATGLAPGESRLWKLLGDVLGRQQDLAGARTAYERALAIRPAYPSANMALGNLVRDQGDFATAYNAFNHAVDDNDEPPAALVGRAAASLYLGDEAGALADLARAAQKAPPGADRSSALLGIVLVRAYQRKLPSDLERAEEAIRMWEELGRADMVAAVSNAVGRLMLETGYPDGSDGWYERGWQAIEASAMSGEERTIWKVRELHGLARGAAARRELERARQLAQEASNLMASDPKNAEHYAWIGPYLEGYLSLAERRWDDAVAELQRSDLERPHLMLLLGEAYARSRDRARALEWYEKAYAAANGLDTESVIVRPLAADWLAKNR